MAVMQSYLLYCECCLDVFAKNLDYYFLKFYTYIIKLKVKKERY